MAIKNVIKGFKYGSSGELPEVKFSPRWGVTATFVSFLLFLGLLVLLFSSEIINFHEYLDNLK